MSERFRVYSIEEIASLPSPRWRVNDLLPLGGFTLMYASAGQGKTFLALDIALCVASGKEFHGRAVLPGPVLYVLGEGRGGLKNRVGAWMKEHGLRSVPEAFFILEAVQFHRPQDVTDLKQQISRMSIKPQVVVIDTFARCAVGVEENEATAMGEWVDAVRRLQQDLDIDVLVLHHAQKQQSKKGQQERGSTALIGAVDTAMRLQRKGDVVTVECRKQKDAEEFDAIALQMKTVDLGFDEFGEPMQSCVLVSGEPGQGSPVLALEHRKLIFALHELGGQAIRPDWLKRVGMPDRTFDRWRVELKELGLIEGTGKRGEYRLTDLGKAEAAGMIALPGLAA